MSENKLQTKKLVFCACALALATVTAMLPLFEMPWGGSVTLMSMFLISLIGYWYGPAYGLMTGVAFGMLQFVIKPYFFTLPQMLTDYPLAFGSLGLSGFFCKRKYGLYVGYLTGICGRWFFSTLSGILFFAEYAWEGWNVTLYSIVYNGAYMWAEAALTLIIISLPVVKSTLERLRKL